MSITHENPSRGPRSSFRTRSGQLWATFLQTILGWGTKGRRPFSPPSWRLSRRPASRRKFRARCYSGWPSFSRVRSARRWETCSPSHSLTADSTSVASVPHWSLLSLSSDASCSRPREGTWPMSASFLATGFKAMNPVLDRSQLMRLLQGITCWPLEPDLECWQTGTSCQQEG